MRYFDNDVEFASDSEMGKVKSRTQDGKWIEIKENKYVRDTTYLIANYEEGKTIGQWEYFNLRNGKEKGSKLLMTEEYSVTGTLLEREILSN